MIRPAFPPRPPGPIGVIPVVSRPPVPGVPGVRPIIPPVIRPAAVPNVKPAEKPQTTVYVGKISPTVDNDFMLSLFHLCGPVKSWKRAQDPTNGTPKGFGFCEFESAEGVLRALRLLSKFNIDGQELVLNVNQATRDYLERYVEKKTENAKKLNEAQAAGGEKEGENAVGDEKNESSTPSVEDSKNLSDTGNKENIDIANSGIVTDEDREADRDVSEKLASMIEERLKTNPLPPPPPQSAPEGSGKSNSDLPAKLRDDNSDVDVMRNDGAEGKNDFETTSESKATTENDRPETSSPERRYDRKSRDREQDLKREKEREIERLERETERERIRKEREQRRKIEEAEREYEKFLRDWEQREKDKEKQRQYEKEREKERERKRKKEIRYEEEDDDDDDDSRKRWRRSALEEKRRKRLREKEDDLADRHKEEKEIAEAKKREGDEQLQHQRDALRLLTGRIANGGEKTVLAEIASIESKDKAIEQHYERESSHENQIFSDENMQNGCVDESNMAFVAASDTRQSGNAPARKLGFGLFGSGKRTTVPSVFHEEEDDAQKEKKMRPLVPIDYSTEELEAVQPGAPPPNLVAAAEFAKRISNINPKEEKPDAERERSRHSYDKSSRDKHRNEEDNNRTRDESKEKIHDRDRDREHRQDKVKTTDNQKLFDAKQLIDMIPKTKEELFSYEINWDVYDQHTLHERMRPWISKKITEFLGEEEKTLVDYIVSSTQEHVKASQMLELLQSILDEEAEMFVLKMWRMLIFEIKKVETGLALRSRS
ncbi:hypothetical protein CRYUN_Cryun21dG0070100 [Craigia yunnanensis]